MHGKIICCECSDVIAQCRCIEGHANVSKSRQPCIRCWQHKQDLLNPPIKLNKRDRSEQPEDPYARW